MGVSPGLLLVWVLGGGAAAGVGCRGWKLRAKKRDGVQGEDAGG